MQKSKSWFETWFDTPYYHLLYANRDDNEAKNFVHSLLTDLDLESKNLKILDLACGRGRHSRILAEAGYQVYGLDLSESNITFAKQFTAPNLNFEQGDMRDCLGKQEFDLVFNLFTSFGYFENIDENLESLKNIRNCLKKDGIFIIDFLNVKALKHFTNEEEYDIQDYKYRVKRKLSEDHIVKEIEVLDGDQWHHFQEKVQLLSLADFKQLLQKSSFKIEKTYGSFNLDQFDEESSDRLILFARAI